MNKPSLYNYYKQQIANVSVNLVKTNVFLGGATDTSTYSANTPETAYVKPILCGRTRVRRDNDYPEPIPLYVEKVL